MRFIGKSVVILALLLVAHADALAWHDTGHMVVAQVAYLRLTPAAKARVDALLLTPEGKRPLISFGVGYYTPEVCERTYDPVQIAVWMDDFRGDSLNNSYAPWHYIDFNPIFDGIPERPNVGPEPENVLSRINWAINTLRKGTGSNKTDAETLGFLIHMVGDVHQPLHAATRYSASNPNGDAGGNGFKIQMPPATHVANLHAFWDAAAGTFGFDSLKRPLDQAGKDKILAYAQEVMKQYPDTSVPEWKNLDPHAWIVESNTLAREVAYKNITEGSAPSQAYTEAAQQLARKRMALGGYRLAGVLNALFVPQPPKQ
ncbi:MAG TPA: S1/P1 nuclease [Pyrinomonadaceae bacterium]|nr:S1/P1 nuclease [Pyrinomonadaceae bacterium]